MTRFILPLLIGFFMDLIFGDPYNFPHIVVLMGKVIKKSESFLRKNIKNDILAGRVLVVLIILIFTVIPLIILTLLYKINVTAGVLAESIMCWQCLAAKGLEKESMKVYYALENKDLDLARTSVGMIVGRDTKNLTKEGIIKAAVETVSENTSDGVIAPIFYMVIGGGVFGYFYKAVNTMDSMIGYKNQEYIDFGKAAARFDDFINFIPSRLSGVLIVVSAFLLGLDGKNSWRIFKRDRLNHKSPNSAQTEAACAGALGIILGGDAWYFEKLYKKQTIGDFFREVENKDIVSANRLMYGATFLMMGIVCIIGIF